MSDLTTRLAAYLRRLGYDAPPPPTLDTLVELHRRHLEQIPYDNLSIQLGRPDPVDPASCVELVARTGRLGYCFHQNGALEQLLRSLGFAVTRRHGHVWSKPEDQLDGSLNHLVLVVSGLPTEACPGGHWWVDVGLGDGFAEPLPIMRGEHLDAGFRYELYAGFGATAAGRPHGPAAWTFAHDPLGTFTGIVVTERPTDAAAVGLAHTKLSTDPSSGFLKCLVVARRDATGVDVLRGCVLSRVEPSRTETRDLTAYDEWRAALTDGVGLPVDDIPADNLRALFGRNLAAHHDWDAAGRP